MVDLKLFRDANNLLQKDIAEYLGVSIAFISSIEKGQAKLPSEKLIRLLDNDRNWDTDSLVSGNTRMRPYYDMKTMNGGQDFGGAQFNAPIYCGNSDEDVERIVKLNMAEYEAENRALRMKVQTMSNELAFLRTMCRELLDTAKKDKPINSTQLLEAGLAAVCQKNSLNSQDEINQNKQ